MARNRCEAFVNWYNHEHKHSALKFVTPHQRHTGEDQLVLARRKKVYQMAKQQRPSRWSGQIRDWDLPAIVALNPDRKRREIGGDLARTA